MNTQGQVTECNNDVENLVRRYEQIRAQVLSSSNDWQPMRGLGTILRSGIRAWMELLVSLPSQREKQAGKSSITPEQAQLGIFITDMMMPALKEAML